MQERLIGLYRERFGQAPSAVLALAGDGSNRAYRRLLGSGNAPIIGVMGPDHEENRAFLSFTRAFRGIDLPVPEIIADDDPASFRVTGASLRWRDIEISSDSVQEARTSGFCVAALSS